MKINPASFQEAVRNVLGGLLANNDKGVTISGIPALSGSGASLDFGSVTPANLASVLGGIISGGDLYDSGYSGTSVFSVANQTIFPDVGELYGTLLTIANNKTSNYTVLQIFFTASVGRVYYRVKQGGAFFFQLLPVASPSDHLTYIASLSHNISIWHFIAYLFNVINMPLFDCSGIPPEP